MHEVERRLVQAARKVLPVAFWLAAWQLASVLVGNDLLIAGPIQTLDALRALVVRGAFWLTVASSFGRIALGFALAFLLALVSGAVAAHHRWLADLMAPLVATFKATPVVCLVVLLLIWFGSTNISGVAVFLVVFPAVWSTIVEAYSHLDRDQERMLEVFHVPGWRRALVSTWTQLLPFVQAISRTVVGMAWKAGVAAELIGVPLGSMGERIYQSKLLLETADLFAWTIVIIVRSILCEHVFLWLLSRSGALSRHLALLGSVNVSAGPRASARTGVLASLRHVDLSYGGEVVVSDVSLKLEGARPLCLCDPSGSGKTTLLLAIAGILTPISGEAVLPRRVSMAFQGTRLLADLSARQNVRLACGRAVSDSEADTMLRLLLEPDLLDRPVDELSGGQRQRVELVRALAAAGACVLLDEPFAGLDREAHDRAIDFVLDHLHGRALVVATHDRGDAEALGARVLAPLRCGEET